MVPQVTQTSSELLIYQNFSSSGWISFRGEGQCNDRILIPGDTKFGGHKCVAGFQVPLPGDFTEIRTWPVLSAR